MRTLCQSRSGYTLFEIIIVLALLACVALCCGGGCFITGERDVSERPTSEENAAEYFAFQYPDATEITVRCEPNDVTGNGFVACIGEMEIRGQPRRYAASCSGNWPVGNLSTFPPPGCK